jgi:hypothetical protein
LYFNLGITEDREDKAIAYQAGAKYSQTKRLKTITTYAENNLARSYNLEFQYSDAAITGYINNTHLRRNYRWWLPSIISMPPSRLYITESFPAKFHFWQIFITYLFLQ